MYVCYHNNYNLYYSIFIFKIISKFLKLVLSQWLTILRTLQLWLNCANFLNHGDQNPPNPANLLFYILFHCTLLTSEITGYTHSQSPLLTHNNASVRAEVEASSSLSLILTHTCPNSQHSIFKRKDNSPLFPYKRLSSTSFACIKYTQLFITLIPLFVLPFL